MQLPLGTRLVESLYEGSQTLVLRILQESNAQSYILKRFRQDYPPERLLARLRHEAQMIEQIWGQRPDKAARLEGEGRFLLLPDLGGQSLRRWCQSQPVKPGVFLPLAIQVVEELAQIHQQKVIHKDLNPSNLLIIPATGQVSIIDYGISSALKAETEEAQEAAGLEGTIPYISPEQTGRMNRAVDRRTDFYSLGVTFFELLSGKLPFEAEDPMEMVHCHIAKEPPRLSDLVPSLHPALVDLVAKLLAKNAEQRYQSCTGLLWDLRAIQQEMDAGQSTPLELANQDWSEEFRLPGRLYGREDDVQQMQACLARCSRGGAEMLLISGPSGMGKSSLIRELRKEVLRGKGFYLAGKFDQFKRNQPYLALTDALRHLVRQLLGEPQEVLNQWQNRLMQALGNHGGVITSLIGEAELILGPQKPLPELGPSESQNRFNQALHAFIQTFASAEHPLVLVLDDLQWADGASLALLQHLMSEQRSEHVLFVGAFREEEVGPGHPWHLVQEDLLQQKAPLSQLSLKPLSLDQVQAMIQDSLPGASLPTKPLAVLALEKTEGNPLFLAEFLKFLADRGLLALDHQQRCWTWDLDLIEQKGLTDNVLGLMTARLERLPAQTLHVLTLAACIGNLFDLKTLSLVAGKPQAEVLDLLWPALDEGLVMALDNNYRWLSTPGASQEAEEQECLLRFLHDRVQQAAHVRLEGDQALQTHLHIGRLRLEQGKDSQKPDQVFALADHFQQALRLIEQPEEKREVGFLLLLAGQRAKASNAYQAACQYFASARSLLGDQLWQADRSQALVLNRELAQSLYLEGQFDEAEAEFDHLLQRLEGVLEKAGIYRLKTILYTNRGMYQEAISAGAQALHLFGMDLPNQPEALKAAVGQEVLKFKNLLGTRPIQALLDLESMQDPLLLEQMHVLMVLFPCTFFANPAQLALVSCRMVNLSMEHGNCSFSPTAYATLGAILGAQLGDFASGYALSRMGLDLSERFSDQTHQAKLAVSAGAFVNHWGSHLRQSVQIEKKGFQVGVEMGDLVYATFCLGGMIRQLHALGVPLVDFHRQAGEHLEFILRTKSKDQTYYYLCAQRYSLALRGMTKGLGDWSDAKFAEGDLAAQMQASPNKAALHWYQVLKLQLLVMTGQRAQARAWLAAMEPLKPVSLGQIQMVEHCFWQTLFLLQPTPADPLSQEEEEMLQSLLQKFEAWSKLCKANFQHKSLLLQALSQARQGQQLLAMELFDQAIEQARKDGFVHMVALAQEKAGEFYLKLGREFVGRSYLSQARQEYLDWGATGYVNFLDQEHPHLAHWRQQQSASSQQTRSPSTSESGSEALDLKSVVKAARLLSGEIVLKNLLKKLMGVVGENAGAQQASLLLWRQNRWLLEARFDAQASGIVLLDSVPAEQVQPETGLPLVPARIIQFVTRTKEPVILVEAFQDPRFAEDPYIASLKPRSVLCMPLLHKGALLGLLYMENNLLAGAFTPARLEMLRLLSAQIAISLENARFYQELEELNRNLENKVEERTKEVQAKNKQIFESLDYAKIIQRSLLPSPQKLRELLPDCFFIWRPRDIVGGDIYYIDRLGHGLILAMMDCTGHGVPGAFMTMIVASSIRRITRQDHIQDPAEILRRLNYVVKSSLQQDTAEGLSDDGLDAGICYLDPLDASFTYAGAKIPLFVHQDGNTTCIKADRVSLGYRRSPLDYPFRNHKMDLKQGTCLYMTTDGYLDQRGGSKGYGLGTRRFVELLASCAPLSMQEQRDFLLEGLQSYRGSFDPQDDITLVGLRWTGEQRK